MILNKVLREEGLIEETVRKSVGRKQAKRMEWLRRVGLRSDYCGAESRLGKGPCRP